MNRGRSPHAVLDLPSRALKAVKIERLLELSSEKEYRLLEVGTGSGGIAHYFATRPGGRYRVTAVDVVDQRLVTKGYEFVRVGDTRLPFADSSFDLVLSNHVLEHVGDRTAQLNHLAEIKRVMKPDGIGYLAVPNRWMVVEPHFRLPFLSWLPEPMRSPYLRLSRRGPHYDCNPSTKGELEKWLEEAGLDFCFLSSRAIEVMREVEARDGWLLKMASSIPSQWLDRVGFINPTLIYRVWRSAR